VKASEGNQTPLTPRPDLRRPSIFEFGPCGPHRSAELAAPSPLASHWRASLGCRLGWGSGEGRIACTTRLTGPAANALAVSRDGEEMVRLAVRQVPLLDGQGGTRDPLVGGWALSEY
jgi:hypothetical protein